MLFLLYIMVFVLEIILLYVGCRLSGLRHAQSPRLQPYWVNCSSQGWRVLGLGGAFVLPFAFDAVYRRLGKVAFHAVLRRFAGDTSEEGFNDDMMEEL